MKTCKSSAEIAAIKETLIKKTNEREQVRLQVAATKRKINSLKQKIVYNSQLSSIDNAKIEYLKDCLNEQNQRYFKLKQVSKNLTAEITPLKATIVYYDTNELDLNHKEYTLCHQLFGKKYSELTEKEVQEYNREIYKKKNKKRGGF